MSKQDASEQVKFLVSCIRHTNNGKPDFAAVAQELDIVSKAAAQKRYERMLKAHGVNGSKPAAKPAEDGDAGPTPQSTPLKRKAPRRAPAGAKKAKKVKDEAAGDDDKAPKAEHDGTPEAAEKIKAEEEDSELSDPPTHASDTEI